eukprot:5359316-Pyramimonas_sp.AAC.1
MGNLGNPWGLFERVLGPFGPSWGYLGSRVAVLEVSQGRRGAVLGCPGVVLGRCCGPAGPA